MYKHTDGDRIELEDMSISDGNQELQLVLSDLMPESNLSFVIELISSQFLLATESFLLSTPEFICEGVSNTVGLIIKNLNYSIFAPTNQSTALKFYP